MTANLPLSEAAKDVVKRAAALPAEGYYALPMLKRPLWGSDIALYFFSEGISSGCFILATLADIFGSGRYAGLVRQARYISFATLLPCPALLIADLGRPERFHHMLRVFKPHSPMNTGAWSLTVFSQPVALVALAEAASLRWMPSRLLSLAGLPFAVFMMAYPGVLLSTTSIPVWARSRWLGALLATSSLASATGALAIAAALDPKSDEQTRGVIHKIESAANIAEAAVLATYVYTAGPAARPLTKGRYASMLRVGAFAAGIALPALIRLTAKKTSRTAAVASGLLSVGGALALKWAIVHAGRDSAEDPAIGRYVTRADAKTPGWMPSTEGTR